MAKKTKTAAEAKDLAKKISTKVKAEISKLKTDTDKEIRSVTDALNKLTRPKGRKAN
jgi:BMFP domain-containing protein YqiC